MMRAKSWGWYKAPFPNCRPGPISPLEVLNSREYIYISIAVWNSVPDSGGGEEHLIVRTCEIVFLIFRTYIRDVVEYPLLYPDLDKGSQARCNSLHYKYMRSSKSAWDACDNSK